jgi:hypothetical protein
MLSRILYLWAVTTILLCACTSSGPETYTPIVVPLPGMEVPPSAISVSVQELLDQPEEFAGEYVEVQGLYRGPKEQTGCEGEVTSPDEWILGSAGGRRIGVKNRFDGLLDSPSGPDGRAIRNTMMKKIAVWGWVRLYVGPIGCPTTGTDGEPRPMETHRVWYIDAATAQFLESVEVD